MSEEDFFTFREYMKKEDGPLTASLEDYMEMTYRLSQNAGYTRIHTLAEALNVQPPSVTKAVQRLAELKLVNYEKYGIIMLTEKGKQVGQDLLDRHLMIESFLKLLGVSDDLLEETEKIEHTINSTTLECFACLVNFFNSRPDILQEFTAYRKTNQR